MKVITYVFTATASLTMLFITSCGTPLNNRPVTAKAQTKANNSFKPPATIVAPTIANDSPGQAWTFPKDPAKVIQQIDKWLSAATVTTIQLPHPNRNVHFMDYIGPSELFFTNQNGKRIKVTPAYYIAHGNHGYYPKLIQNVVSYKDGQVRTYLKCPQLFQWLGNDNQWGPEFRMESYTPADKKAIAAAKAFKWGGSVKHLFPDTPGINHKEIPLKNDRTSTLRVTVETLVSSDGANRKVTFIEVWNNGKGAHRWTYVVSPVGHIMTHTESGDPAPQNTK